MKRWTLRHWLATASVVTAWIVVAACSSSSGSSSASDAGAAVKASGKTDGGGDASDETDEGGDAFDFPDAFDIPDGGGDASNCLCTITYEGGRADGATGIRVLSFGFPCGAVYCDDGVPYKCSTSGVLSVGGNACDAGM